MGRQAWREDASWQQWLFGLGETLRAARETVSISQERLSRAAGVSQASLSRVEMGRGLGTPLVLVLRVASTLRAMIAGCDPRLLSQELRTLLAAREGLPARAAVPPPPLATDERLGEIIAAFEAMPPAGRQAVLTLARTLAGDVRPAVDEPPIGDAVAAR